MHNVESRMTWKEYCEWFSLEQRLEHLTAFLGCCMIIALIVMSTINV